MPGSEEDVVSFGKHPKLKLPEVKDKSALGYIENDPTELETPRGQKGKSEYRQ